MTTEHAVLLVEDDEGLRYAFSKALMRSGHAVDEVGNGGDAIRLLNEKATAYCCVILDMLVPTVHGSSVISHIARIAPKLTVIAVTGYPDRVLFADQADRYVVKAIFVKPVEPLDIAAYVKSRCSHEPL